MATKFHLPVGNVRTKIVLIVAILLIILGLIFLLIQEFSVETQPLSGPPKLVTGDDYEFSGEVIQNYTEQLPVDGAAYLFVETASDNIEILNGGVVTNIKVIYHPGVAPCVNQEARDRGLKVNVGDKVDVYGKAISTDTISTCESERYYIDTELSLPK